MIGGDFRKEKIVVGWTARGQPTEPPAARPAREQRPVQVPGQYPAYVKTGTGWWFAPISRAFAARRRTSPHSVACYRCR